VNRDDIIRMAREAGWEMGADLSDGFGALLMRYTALVAAREREQCALVCENIEDHDETISDTYYSDHYANAIRARGEEPKRHPGYIVGDHWLQAAYTRICTGETEDEVMTDYGWQRESR
jgi:hypothetical protein